MNRHDGGSIQQPAPECHAAGIALARIIQKGRVVDVLDPDRVVPIQIAIRGVTSVVIEFAVLAGCGYLAGRATAIARQPSFVTITNRLSGGLLVGAGVGVALRSEG